MNRTTRRTIRLTCLLANTCLLAAAHAEVTRLVHYQGKLRSAGGGPVNGHVSFTFRLYGHPTQAMPLLFEEAHANVAVTNGLFNALIGAQTVGGMPDSALDAATVYLGVAVNGGAELSPRTLLASAPHARKSRSSEEVVRPGTFVPAVSVDAGGRVGVGTTNPDPSARLDVASDSTGFLPPRMTTAQRTAIASPAPGLIVFNTESNCLEMYTGTNWKRACFDCPFPLPVVGNNGPLCEGDTLNLTAAGLPGMTYAWTGPNNFTSTEQNPTITEVTTAANGPYAVSAILDGCTADAVSTIVTISATPASPTVDNDGPVCPGDDIHLTSTNVSGGLYNWFGPNGFSSNAQNPTISNASAAHNGDYTLTVAVNGCAALPVGTTVSISPAAPSQPGAVLGPNSFCPGESVVYSISAVQDATNYVWSVPPGSSITNGQDTTAITVSTGSNSGNVVVTASNSCGSSPDRVLAIIAACPTCFAIKTGTPGAASGVYTLDPDGSGSVAPFSAYCDMTTDGGGWTLIGRNRASGGYTHAPGFYDDGNVPTPSAYGSISLFKFPNSRLHNSTDFMWLDTTVGQYVKFKLSKIEDIKAAPDTYNTADDSMGLRFVSSTITGASQLNQWTVTCGTVLPGNAGNFIYPGSGCPPCGQYGSAFTQNSSENNLRAFIIGNCVSHEGSYGTHGLQRYGPSPYYIENIVFMFK